MGDSKYLDIVKSLNLPKVDVAQTPSAGQSKYSDIARQIGREQRKEKLPGAGAAERAGETAGAAVSTALTPFAYERGAATMLYLYQKVFGEPGEAEFYSRLGGMEAMDKEAQAAGGVRDTVGRTLAGMTAATVRGAATTLEMVTPDSVDPFGQVEGFARGMAATSAVTSDTFTDKVTAAVTNGVGNIALGVLAPAVAAPAFFFQGAGGAANEYDNAFVEGKLTTKDGIYRPSGKYIAALKGGVIEAATEWFGAKAAAKIGKSVWGRAATAKMKNMNPAMKFATGVGLAYGAEAAEEGAASLAYSATRGFQGEQRPQFGTALTEALTDAFYGGFGGAGAHPFIAVAEASQAKIMRDRISADIRRANGPFSDEKFWDAMPRATVDSLKGMTPAQRDAELQTANSLYHQANADRQVGATAVNNAAATLEKAQKQLKTASKSKDQAKIDAAQKAVDAAQAAYDSAFANQATLGAELLAARTRLITIAAFNARNTPVIERTAADVLSELKMTPSSATTDSDKSAEEQIKGLGYDIQFFDSADPDVDPAFYSPSAPNTIFLKSGMTNEQMLDGVVFAHHEAMHIIQATDGDLYSAMRKAFDEQSVVEAGVQYFNDKLRMDDRLAQSAASSLARQMDTGPTMPTTVGGAIEQRAGRTLLQAEGQARVLENGVRELLRSGKAPGFLGELIVKMGLRGRQAATALRVRKMMLDAAAKRGKVPSAVGKPVALTEFGAQIEEAKGVLRAQQMMETPPKAPAAPTPAAAPAAAAAAPSAAPVPPSASAAVVTASGMTPAEAAAAQTPDFKAMVNLAVNSLRKTDKKWAEGKRLYPIAEQMERDPAALSPEDRKIGEELRAEMTSQFGKDYAVLWARARGPAATVEQKREKKSGRFVGAPKWVGKSPVKLEKLRAKLRQLAMEGEAGKMWYENSSRAILAAANGDIDEAEKIVALIAIYSPNATVPANTSMALTAYYQWKAGVQIKAGFRKADEKATDLLVNGKAWSGIKTNSFYQNLMVEIDPSKLDPGVATMDMWMALAFDYGDKALDQGPKYVFAENEIRRLADELGWKPHQVQAAIWTAMKGRIDPIRGDLKKTELRRKIGEMVTKVDPETGESKEVYRIVKGREYDHFRLAHKMGMMYALRQEDIAASKYDFSNAINDRMVQMSWEATPSTTTGRSLPGIHRAPIEQQFEYLKEIMDVLYANGRDVIADLVGLPQGTTITGFSAWFGKVGAGAQTFIPVPLKGAGKKRTFTPEAKKLLNLAALVRGFVMEQDSVVYHTPVWDDAKIRHNGIQIYTQRPLNRAEMTALYAALQQKFNTTELAPGYRNDGARVLNFTDIPNAKFHEGVKEVIEGLPDDFGGGNVKIGSFRSESGMAKNDWSKNPNGESYLDQIESIRPDILGGVRDLRSRIQSVNQRFDSRYGWSALAARRGGTPRDRVEQPSAGALAPLAGAPVIRGFHGPDPVIVAVAERYAASRGIDLKRQSEYADVDLDRARRIADAYEKMEHKPQDPAVAEAYRQLIEQTTAQYQALVEAGYEFYFVDLDNDPYADQQGGFGNPYNAVRDLRANRRMAVFPTESGFGSGATDLDVSNNPLLADTGLQWAFGRPGGPLKRVTANDLFRAVHDAMGHSLEGAGFRARGEENAWQAHVRLFTGAAIGAMTSETRGQNSWLNFGPFGEKNRDAKVEDTTFADQKVGLMPSWTWEEGRVGSVLSARRKITPKQDADYLAAVERGDMTAVQRMVDAAAKAAGYLIRAKHGSTSPDIRAFDFSPRRKRFTGKSESGVVWFSDNDNAVRRYASTLGGIDVERVINELNEDMLSPARGGVSFRNEDGSYSGPYHTWSNVSDRLTVFYLPPESGYEPGYYAAEDATDSPPTNIGITPDEAIAGLRSWLNKQEGMKKPLTMSEVIYDSYLKLSNPLELDFNGQEKTEPWDDIVAKATAEGHDGIIIKNVIDVPRGMFGSLPLPLDEYRGTVYGIFFPEQAKSANPITRDKDGNIIPLSQRFDETTPEILRARRPSKRFFDEVARGERKWALTDANGDPVMVYHGSANRQTQVVPFASETPEMMFFSSDTKVAESYSREFGQLFPAWISGRNSAVVDFEGADWNGIAAEDINEQLTKLVGQRVNVSLPEQEREEDYPYTNTTEVAKTLFGIGYDVVVIRNVEDSWDQYPTGNPTTVVVVSSADPIINALTNQRVTDAEYKTLAARRQPTAERRDIAASVVLDVARQRLQQLLDSLPANQATWSEANRAAVATARQNVLDAARDLKRKPSRADAASLAYQIGRREGLLSGEVRGQTVAKREEKREAERLVREERNKQRVEARAKRMKMRSEFRDRVAGLMLEIESAAATNDELRNRIKVMRKYEKARKAVAARKAENAVLKAWIKGLYKGRAAGKAEGIAEAKKAMTDIRKAAVQVIATLPPKLRGKYVNAVATMKTAAGINKIARRVVQDLAMAEAIETVAAINRMEKRIKKIGLRAETRTDLRDDLSAARSMLASGRKRMLPFTDTADLAARTEAARRLLESAVQRFDVERAEYRDARDLRADEAAADAAALGATLATMPKLKQGRLSSMAPKRGVIRDIFATIGNADIYTLMQAIEGGSSGVLGKMWAGFSEAKGNMTLDRKRIDERIDAALRGVGYAGYDGYATNAAGLYGESSAESVTVTLGGNPMTITVDQMLHLAAFDDDTVALLTDENDPTGTPGAPIVFSTYRNSPKVYMTQQEFAAIRANLTNGQRQLIDEMKAILEDEIRTRAFDIHFQIHGRQPDIVPGYFPRQRLGDEVGEIVDVNALPSAVMNTMLSNAGFLQQRVAAKSTLVVGGMMRTMDKHLDESLRLIHLSMPLRYAMTVLKNSEVKAGIESTMGDGGNDMIRKLVLNGVGLSGKPQGGLIEGINANISGALITLNPKTWLRQLGGAFRLMSEMPVGAWAKGVAQMAVMTPAQRRDMAREIESMNGYFYDRHRRSQVGIFANVLGDPNTARDRWAASLSSSARSMSALGESVAAGQFARAARDLREGVLPISRVLKSADGVLRMVDRQIMLAAFLGMRADVMASNPSMTPAEVNIAAAKLAEQAFRKTQNVSDPLDDTVYAAQQKFSQGIGRLMFPFSSDPLKGYNQIRRAAASGDPALIGRTAAGVAGNMALSAAVNPLWTAAGIAIANALGGGGDEEDEEMIKQMAMEQEFSYIAPRIASDAAAATFGYLGMLGGGIVDGALGSAERADDVMEPLVVRFFGDISQYAAKGDLPSLSATGLQMAGVPVVAPVTTVTGVLKKAAPSDRKLLEYYRKLDKAGQLNAAQRQRLNVLAARERIRLAQERRAKQLQE